MMDLYDELLAQIPDQEYPVRDVGLLHTKSANELAQWISSGNLLEAAIGAAVRTIQQGAIFPQVKGVRLLTLTAVKGSKL